MFRLGQVYSVVAGVIAAALLCFVLLLSPNRGAFDFQAFYCAGVAVNVHADPYRMQPLVSCEHAVTDGTYARLPAGTAVPAPVPGYDLALFALLAELPFGIAKAFWGLLLGACIAISLYATYRVTGQPFAIVFVAAADTLILPSLGFGEPFALFAAAATAATLCLQQQRYVWAGVLAALALVEPNLGLPLCVGLYAGARQTRLPLAVTVLCLAALSVAVLGVPANVEYVRTILPLQAISDITSDAQLSVAAMLHAMHVGDALAFALCWAFFVFLLVLGVFSGIALARRYGEPAFIGLTPVAFAFCASSYVHISAWFAAMPLALLLLRFVEARQRIVLVCAIVLLAVPWADAIQRGDSLGFALVAALLTFFLLWQLWSLRVAFAGLCAVFAFLYFVPQWYVNSPHTSPWISTVIPSTYAQAGWQQFNVQYLSSGSTPAWVLRALTWVGQIILVGVAIRQSDGKFPQLRTSATA